MTGPVVVPGDRRSDASRYSSMRAKPPVGASRGSRRSRVAIPPRPSAIASTMLPRMDDLSVLEEIRAFVAEREWEPFHDPKNLAMAVASEAGELCAELRWVASEEADAFSAREDVRPRLEDEAADVAICLLMFCDRVGIDLTSAMHAKLVKNRAKYPVGAVLDGGE